jgi:amino acid adenylation domain-containing protein/FkbM family methyltransferase
MSQDILRRRSELSTNKLLLLEKRLKGKYTPASEPQVIPRRSNVGPTPLSFAQQRLWFIDRMESGKPFYNVPVAVRLKGALNVMALEQTFTEIIRRHESLRTNFVTVDGQPMQNIDVARPTQLPVLDLSDLEVAVRDAEALRVTDAEMRKPFDLTCDPLLRTTLLRLAEEEHIALLTMHHIVSDGWSVGVLVKEVAALYKAFSAGKASPIADLPIQYADYAAWQREWLTGEVLQGQLNYWKQQLQGAPPVLDLPTDRPRPTAQSHNGAFVSLAPGGQLSGQLNALCQKEGVTLYMLLLAAFQTLLYRYSGQTDIIVGTPIAGRTLVETEGLIGFFVNTLALRSNLSGNPTFKEFLQQVREDVLGAYANQDIPFEKLVEELAPERSLTHNPLVQVVFSLQNSPQGTLEMPGLTLSPFGGENRTAKFDMTLGVVENPEGIHATLAYSTDLFNEATAQSMLSHFHNLLQSICAHPETCVQDISLLSPEESRHLLHDFNPQVPALAPASCLHHLFEHQAAVSPHAIALTFDGDHHSYGELNDRANLLARHLRNLGVGPESRVGVLCDSALDLLTAILGVVKAGAAYLPLDPGYPHERLLFMLEDAGAQVVVTQQSFAEPWLTEQSTARLVLWHNFNTTEGEVMLSIDGNLLTVSAGENLSSEEVGVTPQNAAYVIYTSGSTGKPKGVVVTHENVSRLLEVTRADFEFDSSDVWTLFHSICFDFSVWELWGALTHGARLVLVPYRISRAPDAFYELLIKEGVTVLNQTPSAFRQLMKVDEAAGAELALRVVIFGGEALEMSMLKSWFERHGDERPRLVNMYGITETTVHVTYRELKASDTDGGSVIGGPLGDLELYVLDGQMQPVPEGVSGELYVGGGGVARGYLGKAELTAQRFVPHPYCDRGGARLYRTGDVARRRADGELEYLGRLDEQVKIRGFRIELGEIETVLGQLDGVHEAVVITQGGPTDQRLVAYLMPDLKRGAVLRRLLQDELLDLWPESSRYRLPNGMNVIHINRGETNFLYKEIFTEQSYLKHGIKLKAGACVFDVGANIGMFSLFVNEKCRDARLYCFEPLPPAFQVLIANASLYAPDAKLFECGLSNRSEQQRFTYYPEATVMSGQHAEAADERAMVNRHILNREQLSAGEGLEEGMLEELLDDRLQTETYECRLRRLSDVIAEEEIEQIDLLKIDVEKSELEVLEGIDEGDWQKIKQIVVEVHDMDGRLEAVQSMLQRHGYQVQLEQDGELTGTTLYNVYASRELTEDEEQEQGDWRQWYREAEMIAEVQQHVREKLPYYMMPSSFVLVSEWPLTSNGKLDKKALAQVKEGRGGDEKSYVAPRTPVEEIIAGIFSEVLSVERVGIEDNFFDLGGHSLLVTLVVSRLREAFHVELPFRTVFDSPSVVDLSLAIAQSIMEKENGTGIAELLESLSSGAQLSEEDLMALTSVE